jgi:Flp pilus assembly protein TadD
MKYRLSIIYLILLIPCMPSAGQSMSDKSVELHNKYYESGAALIEPYMVIHNQSIRPADVENIRKGIELLNEATLLNTSNWPAYWIKGKGYQALGESESAYSEFKKSYEIQKDNPDVARELMIECLNLGRAEEGVTVSLHALSLQPNNSGLNANVGLAYLIAGDLQAAKKYVARAIVLDDSDRINKNLLSMIKEVESGKRDQPKKYGDLFK